MKSERGKTSIGGGGGTHLLRNTLAAKPLGQVLETLGFQPCLTLRAFESPPSRTEAMDRASLRITFISPIEVDAVSVKECKTQKDNKMEYEFES